MSISELRKLLRNEEKLFRFPAEYHHQYSPSFLYCVFFLLLRSDTDMLKSQKGWIFHPKREEFLHLLMKNECVEAFKYINVNWNLINFELVCFVSKFPLLLRSGEEVFNYLYSLHSSFPSIFVFLRTERARSWDFFFFLFFNSTQTMWIRHFLVHITITLGLLLHWKG